MLVDIAALSVNQEKFGIFTGPILALGGTQAGGEAIPSRIVPKRPSSCLLM